MQDTEKQIQIFIKKSMLELVKLDIHFRELSELEADNIDAIRPHYCQLRRAADSYWQMVKLILEGKQEFKGRERRGAQDPVNLL